MLEFLADLPWAQVFLPEPGVGVLVLALLGAAVLLLPRAVPGRALGLVLLLPLLVPRASGPAAGQFELDMAGVRVSGDVGQALLSDAVEGELNRRFKAGKIPCW